MLGLGELTLLVELGLRVGRALMSGVAPLLALEIHRGIAPRRCGRATAVLGLETLVAGPGLDHRAVHAEVLIAHEALPLRQVQHPLEEFAGQIRAQQPIPVDAKDRTVPDRRVHLQPYEPTEHQVVVQLLDQLPFAAHREKDLQQQRSQQILGWDRRAARVRIAGVELLAQALQDAVDHRSHSTNRMILRHAILQADITEHRGLRIGLAAHGIVKNRGCENPVFYQKYLLNYIVGVYHQPVRPSPHRASKPRRKSIYRQRICVSRACVPALIYALR
jgi:hypothetical protein